MSIPLGNPPNHLLTLQQAEERLQPYKADLDGCIQHGWDVWNQDYLQKHHILRSRSRAAIVFDEIVFKAQQVFCQPNVKFDLKNNTFLLFIGEDIIVRFKKIKRNGRCSNVNTRQQALFQLQQMVIPGMEPGTALTVGYALDDLQQKIARKTVVCQFNNRVLWTIELLNEADSPVVEMPQPTVPEAPKQRFEAKPELLKDSRQSKKKKKGKGV